MKFDLHLHSTYSDGILKPNEIVDLSLSKELSGISITDHDTTNGLKEAIKYASNYPGFKIIPGIELSCIYENEEVHILGYFIDYESRYLANILEELRINRLSRTYKIIDNLKNCGFDINKDEVINMGMADFTGRVHIAKILVNKGYVNSIGEAFNKYLAIGKAAYVKRKGLSVNEAINLIKEVGGVPILAHPGLLKNHTIINYCVSEGIEGIECIHSKHTNSQIRNFISYAKSNNLLITGGSDCHGELVNNELLLGKYYCEIKEGETLYGYL